MTTAPPISQRIIGLTGGIATGKTTVSDYLATAHQLPVLDADVYAREAVGTSPIAGPVVVVESQTTTVVPRGFSVCTGADGALELVRR